MGRLGFIFFSSVLTLFVFQNCSEQISNSQVAVNSEAPTATQPTDSLAEQPLATKLVTAGIGSGGTLFSSSDFRDNPGFHNTARLSGQLNNVESITCIQETDICYGPSSHSHLMWRSITYGKNRFVAVGGWQHAISSVSIDGINWSPRQKWIEGNRFVSGKKTSSRWLDGVAFGKNRFAAISGPGRIYYSEDGQTWVNDSEVVHGGGGARLRDIIFIGNGFYVMGDNGVWAFSSDGEQWNASGIDEEAPRLTLNHVTFDGRFLWAFKNFSGEIQIYRMDPNTPGDWQPRTRLTGGHWAFKIIYAADIQQYFMFGREKTWTSTDAINWTLHESNQPWARTAHYRGNGQFILYTYDFQAEIPDSNFYFSNGGIQWIQVPDPLGEGANYLTEFATGLTSPAPSPEE